VSRSPDQHHVVVARQQPAKETSHRAGSEDENFHVVRMSLAEKMVSSTTFALFLFYKIARICKKWRFRYF